MDFSKASGNKLLNNVVKSSSANTKDILSVPLDQIVENEDNDKIFNMEGIENLAAAIRENGWMGAIEVYRLPDGKYEIVSGHRRYRAMKLLGEKAIPCIISRDEDAKIKARKLLASNVFNREMTADDWNKAIMYYISNLSEDGHESIRSKKECKEFFHLNDSQLSRYLSLSKLVPELRKFTKIKEFPSSSLFPAARLTKEDQKVLARRIEEQVGKLLNTSEDGLIDYSAVGKNFITTEIIAIKNRNANYTIDARLLKKKDPEFVSEADNASNTEDDLRAKIKPQDSFSISPETYSIESEEPDKAIELSAPFKDQVSKDIHKAIAIPAASNKGNDPATDSPVVVYLKDFLNKLKVLKPKEDGIEELLLDIKNKIEDLLS